MDESVQYVIVQGNEVAFYPAAMYKAMEARALAAEADAAHLREMVRGECENSLGLSTRLVEAEAEVQRLRAIVEGMAERIAAQSDQLSRNTEGFSLARLEAWLAGHQLRSVVVHAERYYNSVNWRWVVSLSGERDGITARHLRYENGHGATLGQAADAALWEWEAGRG